MIGSEITVDENGSQVFYIDVTNFQPNSHEQPSSPFPQLKQHNESVDYQIFKCQYNTLRNCYPDTFD